MIKVRTFARWHGVHFHMTESAQHSWYCFLSLWLLLCLITIENTLKMLTLLNRNFCIRRWVVTFYGAAVTHGSESC